MQQLSIPYLPGITPHTAPDALTTRMQALAQHTLAHQPWPQFATDATISFRIAYTDDRIVLLYEVQERQIRAENKTINSPVYEDSCVEFFIATAEEGYYNFEFNCIGTALGAYGNSKEQREFLPDTLVKAITTHSQVALIANGMYHWQLLVQIPFVVLQNHHPGKWPGLQCRGNFYKCGDKLAAQHFLSWTPIDAPQPNFHLPQYFGYLQFERQ
ncbi:carbohydrate-binding family 9-like protein [Paracnuella aquatica]|uniref:carbohydrate-binding family 9-like protein n=1 Tax=Paracnuella aquatica TaxID=2268757 RepID=UPI000DEFACED|nr:carbohydrate-binding family 9-like protein [Paracnuella aquatica]RPD45585.1 hypothetical protein DRJ53_15395 [Paracnuella aquatica]